MKILLTGHKGWVGNKLYNRFSTSHEVTGLDAKTYSDFAVRLKSIQEADTYFDYVIHCGAISDSAETGNILWQMNYQATTMIADLCAQKNMKMVFISSCAAIEPDTPYGWSKLLGEFYIQRVPTGIHHCILRPYNIWGFDECEKDNPSIVYKIMSGTLPHVYKGCVRDFVFVNDVVSAIESLTTSWLPGIFELGVSVPIEIGRLVKEVYNEAHPLMPKTLDKCPVTLRRVAFEGYKLPNWNPKDVFHYLREIRDTRERRDLYAE